MKITQQQYESALALVEQYKRQHNQEIMVGKRIISNDDFCKMIQTKPDNRITVNDIVIIPTRNCSDSWDHATATFEQVVCTGYCGRDEFWGRNLDGEERYFTEGSRFKCVGEVSEAIKIPVQ
ncbi:hypothetical protein GCM10028807_63180 [Spirosoma daeguense]